MSIRIHPRGDAAVVQAERRLVVGNRQVLKNAVMQEMENGRRAVVIDLGQTDLIDSGGLGVLVTLYRHVEELGGNLVLANLSEEIAGLMRLTKLDTIFTVADTVDEAVERIRVAQGGAPAAQAQPATTP